MLTDFSVNHAPHRATFSQVYYSRLPAQWRPEPAVREQEKPSPLTPKETHLLQLLVGGFSNQALADSLHVTQSTVRTHLRNIYAKLGATSRTQAVALGRRHGLINPEDCSGAKVSAAPKLCASTSGVGHVGESESFARFMHQLEERWEVAPQISDAAQAPVLTVKEIRLLQLLSEGHSNKVLADKVFVSQSTVRTHLRHIYAKLGASNRTHTVALGRQQGLIR